MTRINDAATTINLTDRDASPMDMARALDADGHLMPDLPEPTEGADGFLTWGTIALWNPKLGLRWAAFDNIYSTTPAELREEAYALLAAADYAERNQE